MMYSIIKKFIFIFIFCSISFSQTGNDFLREYPFDKRKTDLTNFEMSLATNYLNFIDGVMEGNRITLDVLESSNKRVKLMNRICGMDGFQMIRIIKKWCDENPDKTHWHLGDIVFIAFIELPFKSDKECGNYK